jgi:palmitoyltransferase ZDHHC6
MWCCPTVPPGDGLKYDLAVGEGEWIELQGSRGVLEDSAHGMIPRAVMV